ncbi:MAG: hypothetical protein A2V98_15975 [Planctomycetes bacterium RBG_16_64_12]|nr:MAG: hypothetical protein A2V98_15975 [Planctomycetes bacterium RBG_16_64_12]
MLRAAYGDRARLAIVFSDGSARILTSGFESACDPDISCDATHLLFAGKRTAADHWNLYEIAVDGSGLRQITRDLGDCRSPRYQSTLYTMPPLTTIAPQPAYQVTFVGNLANNVNEYGAQAATHLYSCKLDGSAVRRLTFNLSSDMDPVVMPNGRVLFASWQRSRLDHGLLGRVGLFGVNIDGTDFALFAGYEGRRVKHMPSITAGGLAVFIEADQVPWDGSGQLSCVQLRRPLHSYRQITRESDGLFHSPSPLADGRILVSRRPADGSRTHGVWRLDPSSHEAELVFDDPRYHDVQAKCIYPRQEPDGRSSGVTEEDPRGKLYCLNVYTSDLEEPKGMTPGSVTRLRVLEGVPWETGQPLAERRILGEIPVEEDGSFKIEIPANTPIELQLLDADGMALRSCGWIWAKNGEPRGCIGCHEDGELVPENWFVDAAGDDAVDLSPPSEQRRAVGFRRDVMPIIARKCAKCHNQGKTPLDLDGDLAPVQGPDGKVPLGRSYENLLAPAEPPGEGGALGKYVHPGRARTSPLVWHIFGRNTSRPWDGAAQQEPVKPMPPAESEPLGDEEKRTLVQWIDMGALWDGSASATVRETAQERANP